MLWVGLTGGIASGKSTVSHIFRGLGFPVVDADQLARDVVEPRAPAFAEVVQAFGPDAVLSGGGLNRKKIAELVFSPSGDRTQLDRLEAIIHPRVRDLASQRREELRAQGVKLAIYDVPLLFEKQMRPLFDRVIVVACTPETQLQRLMKRDALDEKSAKARIKAQLPLANKIAQADEVVHNEGSLQDLQREIAAVVARLLKQS